MLWPEFKLRFFNL